MSADNYIAVREIDGKWHTWMVLGGYEEEDWTTPDGYYHKEFDDKLEAIEYGSKICRDEIVEYGLTILEDKVDKVDKLDLEKPKFGKARDLLRETGYQDDDENITFTIGEWYDIDSEVEKLEKQIEHLNLTIWETMGEDYLIE